MSGVMGRAILAGGSDSENSVAIASSRVFALPRLSTTSSTVGLGRSVAAHARSSGRTLLRDGALFFALASVVGALAWSQPSVDGSDLGGISPPAARTQS